MPRLVCDDESCPVTGCDGREYDNECEARSAGVDYALRCARGTQTGSYVVDFLQLAAADPSGEPSIAAGMNLDGRVSDAADAAGCLHTDISSPAPDSETGVDNQFGPIMAALGSDIAIDFAPTIAAGELLILLDVRATASGGEIDLHLGATVDGRPPELAGERLAPSQTLQIVRLIGRLVSVTADGRTRAGPGGIYFPITPASPLVPVSPAHLYGDFRPGGVLRGVVGGGFLVQDAVAPIVALNPDAIPAPLVRAVGLANADLAPDFSGDCVRMSSGWIFTAVPATIIR